MAVLGFSSEYNSKTLDDILHPQNSPCFDFSNENGFSLPPVTDVSKNCRHYGELL